VAASLLLGCVIASRSRNAPHAPPHRPIPRSRCQCLVRPRERCRDRPHLRGLGRFSPRGPEASSGQRVGSIHIDELVSGTNYRSRGLIERLVPAPAPPTPTGSGCVNKPAMSCPLTRSPLGQAQNFYQEVLEAPGSDDRMGSMHRRSFGFFEYSLR
jgi:hypothetical protein